MRFYAMSLTNIDGSSAQVGPFPGQEYQFTSLKNGQTLPGALNVEIDLPVYNWDAPMGGAFVRIWGIGITDLEQATNLNGLGVKFFGGMSKGLPLANPAQAGLLIDGVVQQAFGNWQGTQQSLDLLIQGDYGTPSTPVNLVFQCKTGAPLGAAAVQTLDNAFPGAQITADLNPALVLAYDVQTSYFQTVGQFATWLNEISRNILNPKNDPAGYQGVKLTVLGDAFLLYDGSTATDPTLLDFKDMIGQPTWIDFATVQVKVVMRGDIQVGDYVRFPPGQQTVLAQSYSQYRDQSTFSGVFQVIRVRHIGNFRQRDANSWVTVIDAVTT